jgi:RsiW-degrading membrane proteinase PrsW (M82 family)
MAATPFLLPAACSLLPMLGFLVMLKLMDSYKLVSVPTVLALTGAGMAAAGLSYVVNGALLPLTPGGLQSYSRYGAPLVEEAFKGLVIVVLLRSHRIAFLIDAAVLGFAVGCGFALVENLLSLWAIPDAGMGTWVVRGFGTAVMHGGATAVFALVPVALLERDEGHLLRAVLPGYAVAVLLHSAFNHLSPFPRLATGLVLVTVPALLLGAFHHGERSVGDWIGRGFDDDADLLALINAGRFLDSPAGRYLQSLKTRFQGPVVADLVCYLRVFTELSLRSKGLVMMRENGFEPALDEATRARLAELRYLEGSIGPTGLLALLPLLPMRRRALRQLYAA